MKIYKYKSINANSLNSLKTNTIYFSDPLNFNDIFEFIYTKVDEQIIEQWKENLKITNPANYDLFQASLNIELRNRNNPSYNRVVCFSETYKEPLMWAHYCDSGTGFCLEFETVSKNNFEWIGFNGNNFKNYANLATKEITDDKTDSIYLLPLIKISYQNKPPRFLEKLKDGYYKYCKNNKWSYEQEWRIIVAANNLKTMLVEFDHTYLQSIIFGPNTSKENIERIKSIISTNDQASRIKFYQMYKVANSYLMDRKEV